jgi:hypothetical protein
MQKNETFVPSKKWSELETADTSTVMDIVVSYIMKEKGLER